MMNRTRFLTWRRRQLADDWAKSSLSSYNANCVEVAGLATGAIQMRDSKDPHGRVLTFTDLAEWDTFLASVRNGEFDRKPRSIQE
jgi:hypothetical protein